MHRFMFSLAGCLLLAGGQIAFAQSGMLHHPGLGTGQPSAATGGGYALNPSGIYVPQGGSVPATGLGASRGMGAVLPSSAPASSGASGASALSSFVANRALGSAESAVVDGVLDQTPRVNYLLCVTGATIRSASRDLAAQPTLLRAKLGSTGGVVDTINGELHSAYDRELYQCRRDYHDDVVNYCLQSPTMARTDGYDCAKFLREAMCRKALEGQNILRAPNTDTNQCTDEQLDTFLRGLKPE